VRNQRPGARVPSNASKRKSLRKIRRPGKKGISALVHLGGGRRGSERSGRQPESNLDFLCGRGRAVEGSQGRRFVSSP